MEFATKPFKIGIMGVFYALIILLSIKVLSMMFWWNIESRDKFMYFKFVHVVNMLLIVVKFF
jgi:hypothetical protein